MHNLYLCLKNYLLFANSFLSMLHFTMISVKRYGKVVRGENMDRMVRAYLVVISFVMSFLLISFWYLSSVKPCNIYLPMERETQICDEYKPEKSVSHDQHNRGLAQEEAEKLIALLYQGINAFIISDTERELFKQCKSESTYGEIVVGSLEELVKILQPTCDDVFYDLGSGKGQAPLYMAIRTPMRKCVGIELAQTRHNYALQAREKFYQHAADCDCIVEFYQGDFTDSALNFDDATIIWMNSTCYPEEVMHKIVQRLSTLPSGLRVISLKALPSPEKYHFKLVQQFTLPMTWSGSVNTHLYILEKAA